MRNAIILVLGCTLLWACESTKPAEEKAAAVAPAVTSAALKAPTPPAAPAQPSEAEVAKSEAQKAVEENPLTPCCRALGRIGFTERSPEYTAAAKECGEGMEAKKTLAQIADPVKKTLKGKALPDECVAK